METTLSERKELLIKEIISLIKNFDYSKGYISFRDKIEINLKPLYRYCIDDIMLTSIDNKRSKEDYLFYKEEKRYDVSYSKYNYRAQGTEYEQCGITIRQFKRLFNTLNILELIVIRVVIQQGNKT
jgi:hypothetical protein